MRKTKFMDWLPLLLLFVGTVFSAIGNCVNVKSITANYFVSTLGSAMYGCTWLPLVCIAFRYVNRCRTKRFILSIVTLVLWTTGEALLAVFLLGKVAVLSDLMALYPAPLLRAIYRIRSLGRGDASVWCFFIFNLLSVAAALMVVVCGFIPRRAQQTAVAAE